MDAATTELLRWIILLPLLGAAANGLLNRSKNVYVAGGIASAAALAAFAVVIASISAKGGAPALIDPWFTWFKSGKVAVDFHLELTSFSAVMLLVVTGIGSLIHIYAMGYMS